MLVHPFHCSGPRSRTQNSTLGNKVLLSLQLLMRVLVSRLSMYSYRRTYFDYRIFTIFLIFLLILSNMLYSWFAYLKRPSESSWDVVLVPKLMRFVPTYHSVLSPTQSTIHHQQLLFPLLPLPSA